MGVQIFMMGVSELTEILLQSPNFSSNWRNFLSNWKSKWLQKFFVFFQDFPWKYSISKQCGTICIYWFHVISASTARYPSTKVRYPSKNVRYHPSRKVRYPSKKVRYHPSRKVICPSRKVKRLSSPVILLSMTSNFSRWKNDVILDQFDVMKS